MASPDPYLFELLDLMQLAFPGPVTSATLAFAPADDGRAALADLTATAAEGAPPRPDLGYPDDEVLDTVNAAVGDLVSAIAEREGQAALPKAPGSISLTPQPDGSIQATVMGEGAAAPAYDRRIDRSEQYQLLHTAPLFAALNATEEQEQAQADALTERIGGRSKFGLDVDRGRIDLGDEADRLSYAATLLCTYHPESRSFVWGWANESFPEAFRSRVDGVRRSATDFGLRALATPELLCPPKMADRLARHAAARMQMLGVVSVPFAGPSGPVTVYVGLSEEGA